jgi:hypothetical protein
MGQGFSTPPLSALPPNNYLHFQGVADSVWVIVHSLGFHPNVTVVNSAGQQVEGDVEYLDPNSLQVTFIGSFAGSAFLS